MEHSGKRILGSSRTARRLALDQKTPGSNPGSPAILVRLPLEASAKWGIPAGRQASPGATNRLAASDYSSFPYNLLNSSLALSRTLRREAGRFLPARLM